MLSGVGLGAFGAHGLKGRISVEALQIYHTAVLYHLVHGLGLFAVAWAWSVKPAPAVRWAGLALSAGIVIFSGSLYLLAVTGARWLGAVTPIGGLLFLSAWGLLAFHKTK
jgi:uncharacterized membrane protein YgdD (TMEM256/DUF423 family)